MITHGDTGSFWSVFKKGVDQATSDLKARGISITQVYANNDVAQAGRRHQRGDRQPRARDRDLGARRERAQGLAHDGVEAGHRDHHGQLRASAPSTRFPHYMVHVGQTEDVAGEGAGKQFKSAGAKKVLIVIHEASNSGLQQRADGVKKILGSGGVQTLTIPNAKSDIPGTKAKVQAAFKANKSLDGFLGLDPT